MADVADFAAVEREARTLFGEYASHWLFKPNKSLAHLSPYELAQFSSRSATCARGTSANGADRRSPARGSSLKSCSPLWSHLGIPYQDRRLETVLASQQGCPEWSGRRVGRGLDPNGTISSNVR